MKLVAVTESVGNSDVPVDTGLIANGEGGCAVSLNANPVGKLANGPGVNVGEVGIVGRVVAVSTMAPVGNTGLAGAIAAT